MSLYDMFVAALQGVLVVAVCVVTLALVAAAIAVVFWLGQLLLALCIVMAEKISALKDRWRSP